MFSKMDHFPGFSCLLICSSDRPSRISNKDLCWYCNRVEMEEGICIYRWFNGYPCSQTLVLSEQLAQISMFFLPLRIWVLNLVYSPIFQISLNDFSFRLPRRCCASLSKQQGATRPSQVITGSCQS